MATAARIVTSGDHSFGIVAQSLGGGNGLYNKRTYGTAGSGGSVNVGSDTSITTSGHYASGVGAQSGPGPGVQGGITENGSTQPFAWNQSGASSTGSSSVTVSVGPISTSGLDAHGIVAQSIRGAAGMLTSSAALPTQGARCRRARSNMSAPARPARMATTSR
ncbi:outer membrane autotransporter barrel [Stappia sp. 22II-S9-Z10]|nr:outer membrane autotransporter barrel [Stappia sp. 22II-S9-Z10]